MIFILSGDAGMDPRTSDLWLFSPLFGMCHQPAEISCNHFRLRSLRILIDSQLQWERGRVGVIIGDMLTWRGAFSPTPGTPINTGSTGVHMHIPASIFVSALTKQQQKKTKRFLHDTGRLTAE